MIGLVVYMKCALDAFGLDLEIRSNGNGRYVNEKDSNKNIIYIEETKSSQRFYWARCWPSVDFCIVSKLWDFGWKRYKKSGAFN